MSRVTDEAPAAAGAPTTRHRRSSNALHLLALSGFAVAQPLFELLARNAEFFVFHRSTALDVWTLTAALVLGPPAILWGLELVTAGLGKRLGQATHLIWIAGLCTLILAPVLKRRSGLEGMWTAWAAIACGALCALVYTRSSTARSFLSVLSPAALLFGVMFLSAAPIRKVLQGESGVRVPATDIHATTTVVFVLFDELPIGTLVDGNFEIEANLFPNFARLAGESTWFRNATTTHPMTKGAVPSILTGRRPAEDLLPVAADYPENLFTLLAGAYRLKVREGVAHMCPDALLADARPLESYAARMSSLYDDLSLVYAHVVLPESVTADLPPVSSVWAGFRQGEPTEGGGVTARGNLRGEAFREFLDTIDASPEPTLYFRHSVLPHQPWVYLPSGRQYTDSIRIPGMRDGRWSHDRDLVALALRRHLLQTVYVDTLLGDLIARLEQEGVYERSIVIVLADHGVSLEPGQIPRSVDPATAQDLMHVPLFIKVPFQTEPRVDDRNVEVIDVLPTLADLLDIELPWRVDGVSAFDDSRPERPFKRFEDHGGEEDVQLELPAAMPTTWPARDHKLELFGAHPRVADLYDVGQGSESVGQEVAERRGAESGYLSAVVAGLDHFARIDMSSGLLPALVVGRIRAEAPGEPPAEVAIAIDGVIRTLTRTYGRNEERADFAALLPEEAFHDGYVLFELFVPEDDGTLRPIRISSLRLVEEDGQARIADGDRRSFAVRPGAIDGLLEVARVTNTRLRLRGWAATPGESLPHDSVVVLQGDRHVFSSRPERDARIHHGVRGAGFLIDLPMTLLDVPVEGSLRLFALHGSEASELPAAEAASWICSE